MLQSFSRIIFIRLVIAAGLVLSCLLVQAQKDIIHFENIGRENGLAQSTVTGILEGNDGFMWFGTAEGLHRFDGYEFKIYKHDARDPNSLSHNYITCLFEDNEEYIWVGTYTGVLDRFNKNTHRFEHFQILDRDSVPNKYSINCIFQDDQGNILVGLDGGGMVVLNPKTLASNIYVKENSSLPNNYVKCFSNEANGLGIWIGTQQGIILFNHGRFKEFSSLELFFNQYVNDILHHGSMMYIVTNGQGLQIWDTRTDEVHAIPSPRIRGANLTQFVLRDNHGNLWIGTDGGGLMKFNGDTYVTYRNNPYNYRSLIGDDVITGYIDKSGILWFGCKTGISKYDPNIRLFNLFQDFQVDGKPTNKIIYTIYETRDRNVWIGSLGGGLARFNPRTEELKVYNTIVDKKNGVETKAVRAIYEDRNGTLWIGTRDEGLFSMDRESETFTHHTPENPAIKVNTIANIIEDKNGRMWIASRWGLVEYFRSTGKFVQYTTPQLRNNPVYQIIDNPKNNELILITFRSGVHLFDKSNNNWKVLQHSSDSSSPNVNTMMCAEPIGNDSFLIGTYGGGLNIFDRNTLKFSSITTLNGLPNDVVYGILKESPKVFWLSTNDGLVRYDMTKNEFRQFNMGHYLQGLEFNEGAYWKTRDGTMYFGGQNGFNYFKPEALQTKSPPPKVALTSFKVLDNEVPFEKDINSMDRIEINYNEDLISFEFSALSFTNTNQNQYEYKLEGYDENWIKSGQRRVAYYGHLSPGSYTFKVKGATHDGVWSEMPKTIQVVVHPPYWQTWWFRILIGVLILALLGLAFYIRSKTIARSFKHRMVDLELKALRSQMNPHFIFNSLNSIQYFVLKNEPKSAYTYLTKFSSLMRMILQNSGVKYITLEDEIEWLSLYLELEKMRLENELEFSIETDDQLDSKDVMIPSMLVQPYVENAIIHGLLPKESNRRLTVTFSKKDTHLVCVIEDNGIGRVKSRELNEQRIRKYKSQGIKLTGERLDILTQDMKVKPELIITDLKDENGNAVGTRVRVELPIVRNQEYENN